MALGNLDGDSHPALAMGPGAAAQVRVHCPALPYFRLSWWAACLQPDLGVFLLDKPWTQCWRVPLQACLLLLPAGHWPCQNCH